VIDGNNHVPLGGQVLGEIGHHEARAGETVGDDHQRVRAAAGIRLGVAQGAAPEGEGADGARRIVSTAVHVFVFHQRRHPLRDDSRIPDFERQRAIITRIRIRSSVADDIDLIGIDHFQRAHPDPVVTARCERGRIRARVPVKECIGGRPL